MNANDEKVTALNIDETMLDLIWQSWGENDWWIIYNNEKLFVKKIFVG